MIETIGHDIAPLLLPASGPGSYSSATAPVRTAHACRGAVTDGRVGLA